MFSIVERFMCSLCYLSLRYRWLLINLIQKGTFHLRCHHIINFKMHILLFILVNGIRKNNYSSPNLTNSSASTGKNIYISYFCYSQPSLLAENIGRSCSQGIPHTLSCYINYTPPPPPPY